MSNKLFLEVECDGDWKDNVFVGDVIDALKSGIVSARIIQPAEQAQQSIDGVALTEVDGVGFLLKADNGKEIFITNAIAQRMCSTTAPTEQQVRQIINLSIENARILSESYTDKNAWELAISDAIGEVLSNRYPQTAAVRVGWRAKLSRAGANR